MRVGNSTNRYQVLVRLTYDLHQITHIKLDCNILKVKGEREISFLFVTQTITLKITRVRINALELMKKLAVLTET